jgi:hypothetical protein
MLLLIEDRSASSFRRGNWKPARASGRESRTPGDTSLGRSRSDRPIRSGRILRNGTRMIMNPLQDLTDNGCLASSQRLACVSVEHDELDAHVHWFVAATPAC